MENITPVWIAYFAGAGLVLVSKLVRYLGQSKAHGSSVSGSLKEWFLEPSSNNFASWLATVGVVWVVGYLYINQLADFTGITGKVVDKIPIAAPVAFLFGCVAEIIAPNVFKWIMAALKSRLNVGN